MKCLCSHLLGAQGQVPHLSSCSWDVTGGKAGQLSPAGAKACKCLGFIAVRWELSIGDALKDAQSGPLSISKAPVHSWCPKSCQN